MDWAGTVFGQQSQQPEAVNLWMGPSAAVSALHKDPYENLFTVWQGCKMFTLVCPAYAPQLHQRPVPSGRFAWNHHNEKWQVQVDRCSNNNNDKVETVPWITTNVLDNNCNIPYRQVRVQPGETLYLPSLWFHRVAQENNDGPLTIAVNLWYDMEFASPLWVYFDLLQRINVEEEEEVPQQPKEDNA